MKVHTSPKFNVLDRCIQHRGASLKTHAQGINEKDLGTRSLLSGYLGHAICVITWEAYKETW